MIGPYAVHESVGRGATAEVWRAEHVLTGTPVALKVFAGEGRERWAEQSFLREARSISLLDHPHVIRLHDVGTMTEAAALGSEGRWTAGAPYAVLDYADGGTAARRPPRAWPALRRALTSLLHALAHAHALGLLHRDVKPANLLIDRTRGYWRLADFGLAASWEDALPTKAGGTRSFAAPEQSGVQRWALGPWTDLYSVGRVAWALVCHRLPPAGEALPPLDARYEVPAQLGAWIRRMAAQDPARRYPTAADALWALERLDREEDLPALRPSERWMEAAPDPRARPATSLGLLAMRPPPFVGRGMARDDLWSALRESWADGHPRLCLLDAPEGTGASRLAEWTGRHAAQMGVAHLVRVSHDPLRGPGHGLLAGLARALGVVGLSAADQRARLGLRLPGTDAPRLDRFARLLSPAADDFLAEERQEWVTELLRAWAGERMLVLWLDDLHWGPESIAAALRLLEAGPAFRVLMIGTLHPEAPGVEARTVDSLARLRAHRRTQTIHLEPLSEGELSAIATGLLALDPDDADTLARRAGGRPGVLVSTLRALGGAGRLREGPTGLRLPATGLPAEDDPALLLPERAETRDALDLAAVLGNGFERRLAERAARRLGWPDPRPALDRLRDEGWLRGEPGPPEREAFVADGQRRRVLDAMRPERAHTLHAAAGALLPESDDPRVAERRARHRLAAGDPSGAIDDLLRSATASLARGEPRLALAALALATPLLAQDDPRGHRLAVAAAAARARLIDALDAPTLSEADLSLALAEARRTDDNALAARAHLGRAQLAASRGRTAEAQHHLQLARQAAGGQALGLRARLNLLAAQIALDTGDLPAALSAVHEAIPLLRFVGDSAGLSDATRLSATALRWADRRGEAVEAASLALACARAIGRDLGPFQVDLALAQYLNGELEAAQSNLRDATFVADRAPHAALLTIGLTDEHRDARDALDRLAAWPAGDPDFNRLLDRVRVRLSTRGWADLAERLKHPIRKEPTD